MVRTTMRRVLTVGVATVAAVLLGAGPASAHFCYFTEANVKAELGRAGSSAFVTFGDLALEFTGFCPDGIQILADAAGVTTGTVIHARTVMAGGTLKEGSGADPKPISHLDFAAVEAAIPTAGAACA
jgi:hypothetical protein